MSVAPDVLLPPVAGLMRSDNDATPDLPTSEASGHRPVLLHPLIQSLQPKPGHTVVDGTLGAGGITAALAERVLPGGRVVAIDRDPAAVAAGRARFAHLGDAVAIEHGDFAELDTILARRGISAVDAVTLDLGISSLQLDDPGRGFSFRFDGPLDMRFDPRGGSPTAADIVNRWPEEELAELIRAYGEESFARPIAASIGRARRERPIATTTDLRQCVERAIPRRHWPKRIHPATKTFQALRIEVNHELESLRAGMQAAIRSIRPGGRLGVIAFHSLEDSLLRHSLHVAAQNCLCPPQQPICTCAHRASLFLLTRKAIRADASEIAGNPRSRSARLRVAQKLDGEA
ncbi:MAG: 16S rRNA (cytosine(1402)-N(4))-methyltransferase RsmH [Candidatus Dormibacteria bacterium]